MEQRAALRPTLHGLEEYLRTQFPVRTRRNPERPGRQIHWQPQVIRYADDLVRHEARCVHGARHLPPTVGRQVYPPSLQAEQLAGQGTPGETTGSTGIVANP